jgi:Mycoplasma protein of unknown function, DUF285
MLPNSLDVVEMEASKDGMSKMSATFMGKSSVTSEHKMPSCLGLTSSYSRLTHPWENFGICFRRMFEQTPAFDADISQWKPYAANNMDRMFYNATLFGTTQLLAETISESSLPTTTLGQQQQFKLLCWDLPNAQVKVQNMFCGSTVRFDPCCATVTQMETSCCNRFCYNTSTSCAHPEHNLNLGNTYGASSGSMIHDDDDKDKYNHVINNPEFHAKENFVQAQRKASLGMEEMFLIVGLIVLVMLGFWVMTYFFIIKKRT